MSELKEIVRASQILAFFTFVSRFLGLVRNQILSHYFGAGPVADAFVAAFTIPNALRRLLGEGALTPSLVSTLTQHRKDFDNPSQWRSYISASFAWLSLITLGAIILGIIFSPWLVRLYVPEFAASPEKFEMTVSLTRFLFPFLLFIVWSAFFMGVLNTFKDFALSAFAPACLSLSVLCIVPLAHWLYKPAPSTGIYIFALAIVLGAMAQVVMQWPRSFKYNASPTCHFDWKDSRVKDLLTLMIPSFFSMAVYQINIVINRSFASAIPGAVSHLFYADLIIELPVALVATSIGTAIIPSFSRLIGANDHRGLQEAFTYSLKSVWFMALPCTAGLIAIAGPIISTLYFTGRFHFEDMQTTSLCLIAYALGLPFFSAMRIALGYFFASQDTRFPFWISLIALFINAAGAWILSKHWGAAGIAAATTISSAFQSLSLLCAIGLRRRKLFNSEFSLDILKIIVASILMGGITGGVASFLPSQIWTQSGITFTKILSLGSLIAVGLICFALLCLLLRITFGVAIMTRTLKKLTQIFRTKTSEN